MTMPDTARRADATPVAGGGPAPRWSPRRLGHHRYLLWAGVVALLAVLVAIVYTSDTTPGPGVGDPGALTVMVGVVLAAVPVVWLLVAAVVSAIRTRVRDDVRCYGIGQPAALGLPSPDDEATGVLARVDVDRGREVVTVAERDVRHDTHQYLLGGGTGLRLRASRQGLTATDPDGRVTHRAARTPRPGRRRARWELTLDGGAQVLRCDVAGLAPVPRRTLVDDSGGAWLVRLGRRTLREDLRGERSRPAARLPDDLSPGAAAFALWFVSELEGAHRHATARRRPEYRPAADPVAESWAGGADTGEGTS